MKKTRKLTDLTGILCVLFIIFTVAGLITTNTYYKANLGQGISPISVMIQVISVIAIIPLMLNQLGMLKVDERLPILFFALIFTSYSLIQAFIVYVSTGGALTVYDIINVAQILLHMVAAIFMILFVIGKTQESAGLGCSWGALGISLVLFVGAIYIYDKESLIHIVLFQLLASCVSALLMATLFMKLRDQAEE